MRKRRKSRRWVEISGGLYALLPAEIPRLIKPYRPAVKEELADPLKLLSCAAAAWRGLPAAAGCASSSIGAPALQTTAGW
jgi:hypothetical protein